MAQDLTGLHLDTTWNAAGDIGVQRAGVVAARVAPVIVVERQLHGAAAVFPQVRDAAPGVEVVVDFESQQAPGLVRPSQAVPRHL